jgi:hypothetical protein
MKEQAKQQEKQAKIDAKTKQAEANALKKQQEKQAKIDAKTKQAEQSRVDGHARQLRFNIIQKLMTRLGYSNTSLQVYALNKEIRTEFVDKIEQLVDDNGDLQREFDDIEPEDLDDISAIDYLIKEVYYYQVSEQDDTDAWEHIAKVSKYIPPKNNSSAERLEAHRTFKEQFLLDEPLIKIYNQAVMDQAHKLELQYKQDIEDWRRRSEAEADDTDCECDDLDPYPEFPKAEPIPYPVENHYNITIKDIERIEQELLAEVEEDEAEYQAQLHEYTTYSWLPLDEARRITVNEMKYIVIDYKLGKRINWWIRNYEVYLKMNKSEIEYVMSIYRNQHKQKVENALFRTQLKIPDNFQHPVSEYRPSDLKVEIIVFFSK